MVTLARTSRTVTAGGEPDVDPPTAEQLARLLAHDLRTPLNAVRGFADLLLAGAAGPVAIGQVELLAEIARAGRALELSVGLAQEVGERREPLPARAAPVALAALLADCGFTLAAAAPAGFSAVAPIVDSARWRRLLRTCHAHIQGDVEPLVRPQAVVTAVADGTLELVMEPHDIPESWQMSVLRERLIRQLAAAAGVSVASQPPHLPVRLRLGGSAREVARLSRG